MIYTCINKQFFSFCFFHTVFLQQAPSNIKYPHHSRGIHDILPALLINVFREVAPDHIISPHPVQQLLRFLQTVTWQNSFGESVFIHIKLRSESQLVKSAIHATSQSNCLHKRTTKERKQHAWELFIFSTKCILFFIFFVLICHIKKNDIFVFLYVYCVCFCCWKEFLLQHEQMESNSEIAYYTIVWCWHGSFYCFSNSI